MPITPETGSLFHAETQFLAQAVLVVVLLDESTWDWFSKGSLAGEAAAQI
jgi:hypothetical protein